jgi:hypothetical protein
MGLRARQITTVLAGLLTAAGLIHAGASWQNQPYSLTMPTSISTVGGSFEGSVALHLHHDVACAVTVSAAGNSEVLTNNGATLTTEYKLTGACLLNGDGDWVGSTQFLTHNYSVQGVGPDDTLTLWVKGTAPTGKAADAGVYTATIVLTASW